MLTDRSLVWAPLPRDIYTLVDDSDPDIELDQLQHLLQTAEAIRQDGHPDWFVWPPIKLLTSEQLFLFVLSTYFMIRGNK